MKTHSFLFLYFLFDRLIEEMFHMYCHNKFWRNWSWSKHAICNIIYNKCHTTIQNSVLFIYMPKPILLSLASVKGEVCFQKKCFQNQVSSVCHCLNKQVVPGQTQTIDWANVVTSEPIRLLKHITILFGATSGAENYLLYLLLNSASMRFPAKVCDMIMLD